MLVSVFISRVRSRTQSEGLVSSKIAGTNTVHLQHALATKASDYTKKTAETRRAYTSFHLLVHFSTTFPPLFHFSHPRHWRHFLHRFSPLFRLFRFSAFRPLFHAGDVTFPLFPDHFSTPLPCRLPRSPTTPRRSTCFDCRPPTWHSASYRRGTD